MSAVVASSPSGPNSIDIAVEKQFQHLAAEWKAERGSTSSITHLAMHPAYQRIIGLGPAAVPLLLRELDHAPDHWFWALKAITGADPVPDGDRGRIRAMADAWLEWGRENGYRW